MMTRTGAICHTQQGYIVGDFKCWSAFLFQQHLVLLWQSPAAGICRQKSTEILLYLKYGEKP
jgi:hypothetical protein